MSLRIAAPKPRTLTIFDGDFAPPAATPFGLDDDVNFTLPRAIAAVFAQPLAYDEQQGLTAKIVDEDGLIIGYAPIRAVTAQPIDDGDDLNFTAAPAAIDEDAYLVGYSAQRAVVAQPIDDGDDLNFSAALTIVDEDGLFIGYVVQARLIAQPIDDDDLVGVANFFLDEDAQPPGRPTLFGAIKAVWTDDDQLVITVSTAIDDDTWLPVTNAQRAAAAQPISDTDELVQQVATLGIDEEIYFFARPLPQPIQFRIVTDDDQLLGKVGPVDEDFFILSPAIKPAVFLAIYDDGAWVQFVLPPFVPSRVIVTPEAGRTIKAEASRSVKPEANRNPQA